jgi:hypothetical protein
MREVRGFELIVLAAGSLALLTGQMDDCAT